MNMRIWQPKKYLKSWKVELEKNYHLIFHEDYTISFMIIILTKRYKYLNIGIEILNNTAKRMEEIATVDGKMQSLGNRMFLTFIPK